MINKIKIPAMVMAALVIVAGGLYVWKSNNQVPATNSDVLAGNSDILPDVPADAAPINKPAPPSLREQALSIINKPVVVTANALPDSVKNEALKKLEELAIMIREDYDYSNQWYDLGAYRKLLGDYAGAIDAYDFVTLIRPNDVISYMNLGEIYAVYLKNYGQAEKNYLQAIKNDPTKASSYMY